MFPKLLQAKQAADLHSPSFNQRMICEVMQDGFLGRHVPTIRALYKGQRDAMLEALAKHFPNAATQPGEFHAMPCRRVSSAMASNASRPVARWILMKSTPADLRSRTAARASASVVTFLWKGAG